MFSGKNTLTWTMLYGGRAWVSSGITKSQHFLFKTILSAMEEIDGPVTIPFQTIAQLLCIRTGP
jgi:hypothetical protein